MISPLGTVKTPQVVNWLLDIDVIGQPGKRHGDASGPRAVSLSGANETGTATSGFAGLVDATHGRIFGFNISVAHVRAEQEHTTEKAGKRMPVEDSYIAATAKRYGLTIATGNEQDFRRPGVKVFNPFTELQK